MTKCKLKADHGWRKFYCKKGGNFFLTKQKNLPTFLNRRQWSGLTGSKGEGGQRALGRRPWGRNSTLFAVILNVPISRNLD